MSSSSKSSTKPLLRGHFHQAAFFIALGACSMLIAKSHGYLAISSSLIYAISLVGLFGVSALYHRPQWNEKIRIWLRRLDHSAIFILIAGTCTPICLLGIEGEAGVKLLILTWIGAGFGIIQSLFWIKAPKWLKALLYVVVGSLALPYLPEMKSSLGVGNFSLILVGGVIYTIGAVVYVTKIPNPRPRVFGYHEIFHILVVVAATVHFIVIDGLVG